MYSVARIAPGHYLTVMTVHAQKARCVCYFGKHAQKMQ